MVVPPARSTRLWPALRIGTPSTRCGPRSPVPTARRTSSSRDEFARSRRRRSSPPLAPIRGAVGPDPQHHHVDHRRHRGRRGVRLARDDLPVLRRPVRPLLRARATATSTRATRSRSSATCAQESCFAQPAGGVRGRAGRAGRRGRADRDRRRASPTTATSTCSSTGTATSCRAEPGGQLRHRRPRPGPQQRSPTRGRVDAALVTGEHTYLFSGDQYVRYSGAEYTLVDEGYPRTHRRVAGRPSSASTRCRRSSPTASTPPCAAPTAGRTCSRERSSAHRRGRAGRAADRRDVGQGPQRFLAEPDGTRSTPRSSPRPASCTRSAAASTSATRARRPRYVDDGYPRTIKDDWGDLPATFESGLDGGVRLRGAHLPGPRRPVRALHRRRTTAASTAPTRSRSAPAVGPRADYRLSDLRTISRFKQLPGPDADPRRPGRRAELGGRHGRPVRPAGRPVRLGRGRAALGAGATSGCSPAAAPRYEAAFDLELSRLAVELFALAGASSAAAPSSVYADVWTPL